MSKADPLDSSHSCPLFTLLSGSEDGDLEVPRTQEVLHVWFLHPVLPWGLPLGRGHGHPELVRGHLSHGPDHEHGVHQLRSLCGLEDAQGRVDRHAQSQG